MYVENHTLFIEKSPCSKNSEAQQIKCRNWLFVCSQQQLSNNCHASSSMLSCTFAWPLFKAKKTSGKSNGWLAGVFDIACAEGWLAWKRKWIDIIYSVTWNDIGPHLGKKVTFCFKNFGLGWRWRHDGGPPLLIFQLQNLKWIRILFKNWVLHKKKACFFTKMS